MQTFPPDAHPDWWTAHVPLDDVELAAGAGRGLVVVVDRLDGGAAARVIEALEIPTVDGVHVESPITVAGLAHAIAVLRECRSRDIDVGFTAAAEVEPALDAYAHLLPRDRLQPLHYPVYRRHGPGFVLVVDDRPDRNVRITFDDERDCATLAALDVPTDVSVVDAATLDMFVRFGIATVVGDVAVGVVPRIRRWPVPLDDLFAPPTA